MSRQVRGGTSFCTRCGAQIAAGSRFCDNCGAPVETRASGETEIIRTSFPEEPYEFYQSPVRYDEMDEPEPAGSGTLKWILIGAGIGVGVLLLIFGTMYFLNQRGEDAEEPAATEATEETIDETESAVDEDITRQTTEQPPVERNVNNPYAGYVGESELYDYATPFFFPDSDGRYLSPEDLQGMDDDQVQKAINDIYARNGYIFKNSLFQNYYDAQDWYYPQTNDMDEIREYMNDCERANCEMMSKYCK